jgi:hypothetical protein
MQDGRRLVEDVQGVVLARCGSVASLIRCASPPEKCLGRGLAEAQVAEASTSRTTWSARCTRFGSSANLYAVSNCHAGYRRRSIELRYVISSVCR